MDDPFEVGSTEIIRRGLLSRLRRLKLVAITAPAGFGKSTLACQLVRTLNLSAVVDCAGVRDELDLAQQLLPALAEESPDRTPNLIQLELSIAEGSTAKEDRVQLALDSWRVPAAASTFIFENAEALITAPTAREFLLRLLGSCPASRSIIICSRQDLHLHLSRFAPPHRVANVRAEDLIFERGEILEIFAPTALDPPMAERVEHVSQGWPIAVLLLARFAREGRLATLLDQLDDLAFEDLHDYLLDQVLANLNAEVLDALVAVTFIPNATDIDVECATGNPNSAVQLAAFERSSPFLSRSSDNTLTVHPLIAAMLFSREIERRGPLLHRTAAALEALGDLVRAAELYQANNEHAEAARTLDAVPLQRYHAPSMRYARVLAGIEPSLVTRYPMLWACNALLKMYSSDSSDLLEKTTQLWNSLPSDTSADKRSVLFAMRVLFMSFVGMYEEALTFIDAVFPRSSMPAVPDALQHGYVLYLRATITARLGYIRDAENDLVTAFPLVKGMDVMGSAVLMLLGADVARVLGDRPRERTLLEQAIAATMPSELWNVVAQRYAEATFGAWLAGEDADYRRYGHELGRIVDDNGVRGLRYFANCVRRSYTGDPHSADMPRWVICGHLIAYGDAADQEEAAEHARRAVELSIAHTAPFLIVLASLALAAVSERERSQLHDQARAAVDRIESPQLQGAVNAIIAGHPPAGMLFAFATKRSHLQRSRAAPRLEIEVLRGVVRSGGLERSLPNRPLALLFALAVRRQPVPVETILDQIWANLDESSARNAFGVCLHRLRQALNDDGGIVRVRDGFRLCDDAKVDLWEIRDRVSALRGRGILLAADREALTLVYQQLCCRVPSRVGLWEWFRSTERFIGELRSEVGQRLAKDALDRGKFFEAVSLAETIIEYDALNEPAHEIAITAHLRAGDRAEALRRYRQYCQNLRSEFECEPSAHITELVRGSPTDLKANLGILVPTN